MCMLLQQQEDFDSEKMLAAVSVELNTYCTCILHVHYIPYGGSIWRRFIFGELAVLS